MKRDLFIMSEEVLDILYRAANRRLGTDIAYAGAITPKEAHRLLELGAAKLVDVRTRAEWEYVGRVADSTLIEWRAYGAKDPNPDFIEQLRAVAKPTDVVMFLCRSGVRSHNAGQKAAAAGFTTALNILEGFEGDLDEDQRRGRVGGWRAAGLPWIQS